METRPRRAISPSADQHRLVDGVVHPIAVWRTDWPSGVRRDRFARIHDRFVRDGLLDRPLLGGAQPSEPLEGAALNARCLDLVGLVQAHRNPELLEWIDRAPKWSSATEIAGAYLDREFLAQCMSILAALPRMAGTSTSMSEEVFETSLTSLVRHAAAVALWPPRVKVLIEALDRGIPTLRMCGSAKLHQLGHGVHRKRVMRAITSESRQLGTDLSTNKRLASELLRTHGLPAPDNAVARDADAARSAARRLGYPVVVKPAEQDRGIGVTVDIRSDEGLFAAFEAARVHGVVLVERHVAGDVHRLFVLNGECVGVFVKTPPSVEGDGRSTVADLVSAKSRARRRDPQVDERRFVDVSSASVLRSLRRQGLGPTSIPSKGAAVRLGTVASATAGGERRFLSIRDVHPDNLRLAAEAAELFDIDVCGIDFITPDIARSHLEGVGAINEINVNPAMPFPDIGRRMVEALFPDGGDGRIRIDVHVGELGEEEERLLIERRPRSALLLNGIVYSRGAPVPIQTEGVWEKARVMLSKRVELAFFHLRFEDFRRYGLPASYLHGLSTNLTDAEERALLADPSVAAVCARSGVSPRRGLGSLDPSGGDGG